MKRFLLILILLFFPSLSFAYNDLPFSTTYNCPEWDGTTSINCEGLVRGGGWATDAGSYEQITTGANYPGGDGVRGQRHWVGPGNGDGTNDNSGGMTLYFNTPQNEIWIRWYMRFESGWNNNWNSGKILYFYGTAGSGGFQLGYPGNDGIRFWSGVDTPSCTNCGWGTSNLYPTGISDGSWHLFEVHVDLSGGVAQAWIDENLVINQTGVNWGSLSDIDEILIGSNFKNITNSGDMYQDFDDIAVSNTGYIGPVGGSQTDTTPPTVSVTNPIEGSIISGNVSFTATASDNIGVSGVQFKVDGSNYGAEDTTPPYDVTVDTTLLSDASHTFSATARDAAGNSTTSTIVNSTVDNTVEAPGELLFEEPVEGTLSPAWYDNVVGQVIDTTEYSPINGSTASLKYRWNPGDVQAEPGGAVRVQFPASDELYIKYYVKYSSSYVGSQSSSHPHEFFLMSEADTTENPYTGPNDVYLHMKIEQNALAPRLIIVDNKRITTAHGTPPIDLTSTTEIRASTGCNGAAGVGGVYDCYSAAGAWFNGLFFDYNFPLLTTNTWHKVEVYIKLNTVGASTTNADGILKYWLNGNILMDYTQVVYRTSYYPNDKFNQFGIAPYIAAGSPVDQTMWVDNISIYRGFNEAVVNPAIGFQGIQASGATH